MTAIEIKNLTKTFGSIRALDDLSFSVPEGALFGLIGPNGAGKTTTFSVLAGYLKPDTGHITVRGQALRAGQPPRGRIAMLPQDAELLPKMSALNVLCLLARYDGLSSHDAKERAQLVISQVGLGPKEYDQKIENLSHGQRRRIGIAQTLLGQNEIICLDEPTAGLDPRAAAELRALITNMRGERTIILSSHNLAEVESVCDHVAILNKGKLVSCGPMEQVKSSDKLVTIRLEKTMEQTVDLRVQIEALNGINAASWSSDGLSIELQLSANTDGDTIINEVVSMIISRGGLLKGIDRGQSLEQRFLEQTEKQS
jgi:ABC-2 type transport system ATP-binding protein